MDDFSQIKLIMGIGNPKAEYSKTYHNIGIIFVDYLAEKIATRQAFSKTRSKNFEYLKIDNLILANSLTYMNESGKAIKEAMDYFKLLPKNILVAHDDVDIALGAYKISTGQGAAGHNGISSIINTLNTNNFSRIRIGIEKKFTNELSDQKIKAGEYVLSDISSKDKPQLEKTFEQIVQELPINNKL